MAAGQGYIEFATGDVLTAAAANGYLASQVVMVFANAAARTSAITSPQEGMFSYLKDTNATEYYSGSAWVAIGGASASGLTLITRQTYTGAGTINVNDVFSSTYDNYRIVIRNSAGTTAGLAMRLRVSGADNSTSNYYSTVFESVSGTSTIFPRFQVNASSFLNGDIDFKNDATLIFDITAPNLTQETSFMGLWSQTASGWRSGNINGLFNATTSFTGFSFYGASGTATGVVSVYGYQKS